MDQILLAKAWELSDRGEIRSYRVWHRKNFLFSQQSPSDWLFCRVSYYLRPDEEAEGCFIEGDPGFNLFISREGFVAIEISTSRHGPIVKIIDEHDMNGIDDRADRCLRALIEHDHNSICVPEVVEYV